MANQAFSLSTFSSELVDVVERASSAVVSVDARHRRPASGIVIGPDLVVTADHVLERDDAVTVRVGERTFAATIPGRDPASDLAVLRVPGLGGAEPPRGDAPRVGQLVLSLSRTGSGGVSSGLGVINSVGGPLRTGRGIVLRQILRTDAAARPGTSGGAIVDMDGRVIAMTTSALIRGLPVGIPSAQLFEIAGALASSTPLRRAYLGVSVQPVRLTKAANEHERGLLIFGVAPDGPADQAGLLVGDVIVGFSAAGAAETGQRLASADDLQDRLAQTQGGDRAAVSVIRGGAPRRVEVTLGARPSA